MRKPEQGRRAAMIFILVTVFIDVLGIGIIIPILPELIKEFAGGDTPLAGRWFGVLASTYALTQFVFAPLLGALSDRVGRRPVILISLFGLGVDYIIMGHAPSLGWLFAGRLVAGVMGASITTANAYIADISRPEDRARNFGLIGVAFGLGFIFGPGLGGLLGGIDLRLPFFVSAGLALVNWLYGFFVLPESLPPEKRDAFSWRKANPVGSLHVLGSYPLVAGLTAVFVFVVLAQRGLETVWVLYTGHRFGWDEQMNGLSLMLVGLMATIVQGGLVRPIVGRLGERRAILYGLVVAVVTYLGYGLATAGWMLFAFIVFGSIGGVAGPAIQSLVAGAVPPEDQGKVQGGITSLMSLTGILAPLIFTAGLFTGSAVPAGGGDVRSRVLVAVAAVQEDAGVGGQRGTDSGGFLPRQPDLARHVTSFDTGRTMSESGLHSVSHEGSADRPDCPNCGDARSGRFCATCGQNDRSYTRGLGSVTWDLCRESFEVDGRLIQTLKLLLFRPGRLTSEFSDDRRARYMSPVRLYLFASFLFVLVLSLVMPDSFSESEMVIGGDGDGEGEVAVSSRRSLTVTEIDALKAAVGTGRARRVDDILGRPARNVGRAVLVALADGTSPERPNKLMGMFLASMVDLLHDPEVFVQRVIGNLPIAMFFLLPFLALALALCYLRKKRFFIEHLVFGMHNQTFTFLCLAVALLVPQGSAGRWFQLFLIVVPPVYYLVALRRYYGDGWVRTLVKGFAVWWLYMVVLLPGFFLVLFLTA